MTSKLWGKGKNILVKKIKSFFFFHSCSIIDRKMSFSPLGSIPLNGKIEI